MNKELSIYKVQNATLVSENNKTHAKSNGDIAEIVKKLANEVLVDIMNANYNDELVLTISCERTADIKERALQTISREQSEIEKELKNEIQRHINLRDVYAEALTNMELQVKKLEHTNKSLAGRLSKQNNRTKKTKR